MIPPCPLCGAETKVRMTTIGMVLGCSLYPGCEYAGNFDNAVIELAAKLREIR